MNRFRRPAERVEATCAWAITASGRQPPCKESRDGRSTWIDAATNRVHASLSQRDRRKKGGWVLPQGACGLDVIALGGTRRYQHQRRIPQIHEDVLTRGLVLAQRTGTDQRSRSEERLAWHLADHKRRGERLTHQKQVVLARDGLHPDVGHELLGVLRDCCSGEVLVARNLLGATEKDLVALLVEAASVCHQLTIPIPAVITGGQRSIRNAVASALPTLAHQRSHVHSLREAAKASAAADLHAKKERQKQVCGVRPLERA